MYRGMTVSGVPVLMFDNERTENLSRKVNALKESDNNTHLETYRINQKINCLQGQVEKLERLIQQGNRSQKSISDDNNHSLQTKKTDKKIEQLDERMKQLEHKLEQLQQQVVELTQEENYSLTRTRIFGFFRNCGGYN